MSAAAAPPATFAGRFAGKAAIVTGAAQGIGREVALRLAREGAQVLAVDRSPLVEELVEASDGACRAHVADLEGWDGADGAVAAATAAFGRLDLLVNNVGGTIWARPFAEYSPAQITAEINRSLFPTLWCCRAALPAMLAAGGGAIVNLSSVATRGINRVPYAAAKGGINALTACLAWEYAEHGIRVNAVAPGGTDAAPRRVPRNGFTAPGLAPGEDGQEAGWWAAVVSQTVGSSLLGRYGTAGEQAAAILFLLSDEASYITGTVLPVSGGDPG